MGEFVGAYHFEPRPEMPWPLFLSLLRQAPRFDYRARLRLLDSVTDAIAAAFGAEGAGAVREKLARAAYPGSASGPELIPNLAQVEELAAAPTDPEAFDG